MIYTIAVDGPVGAGKSSVADQVAERLHILHLDTGAMYRAFAYQALKEGVALDDGEALSGLAARCMPQVRYMGGVQHTLINGEDVTGLIRTPEISMAASTVSRQACVRSAMVAQQQALARRQSMLLDGRDIGTRVLPNATLKIFLTASAQVRAKRRFDELQQKGDSSTYEQVLAEVIQRDEQDSTRQVDPLRPAQDAQVIDTSDMSQEQVVEEILRRIQLKLGHHPPRAERFTPMYRFAFGLAGVLFAVRFGTIDAAAGTGYELNVVAAAVVGGVAVFGGSGTVWGAALGALLLTVIGNALAVLDINQFWQQAIVGALILLAIGVDRLVAARTARVLKRSGAKAR